jgi:hypothetical protein
MYVTENRIKLDDIDGSGEFMMRKNTIKIIIIALHTRESDTQVYEHLQKASD